MSPTPAPSEVRLCPFRTAGGGRVPEHSSRAPSARSAVLGGQRCPGQLGERGGGRLRRGTARGLWGGELGGGGIHADALAGAEAGGQDREPARRGGRGARVGGLTAGRRPDRWPAVPPAGEAGVRLPHRLLPGGGREDHRLWLPLPPGRLPAQRLECHGLHHRLPGVRPPGRPRGSLPPRALLRHVTPRCSGGRSSLRP